MKHLLPEGWPRPKGYSNGISVASGRTIYVAGLVGWNKDEIFESDKLTDQFKTTLENIVAVLKTDGAGPEHVVRMTWYITDKSDYLSNLNYYPRLFLNYRCCFNFYFSLVFHQG